MASVVPSGVKRRNSSSSSGSSSGSSGGSSKSNTSASAPKRTTVTYGSGGSSSSSSSGSSGSSSSTRKPVDYSSIGGSSGGSSSSSSSGSSKKVPTVGTVSGSSSSSTTASAPQRTTVSYDAGGSSSGRTMMETGTPTSPGRVAANSYESGKVTVENDGYGGQYLTSPSGKVTYIDPNGNATVLASSNKSIIGTTYYADGTSSADKTAAAPAGSNTSYTYRGEDDYLGLYDDRVPNPNTGAYDSSRYDELLSQYEDLGGEYAKVLESITSSFDPTVNSYDEQAKALQEAMERTRAQLQSSYDASALELNNMAADSQRQAYINQQRAMKAMPQMMAAAGYSGGVSESTAANIMNEYQNALIDIDRAKAEDLARMQADLANGLAASDTQYQIELANALQAAEQLEAQQRAQQQQIAMQQAAALMEQQKWQQQLALQQRQYEEDLELRRQAAAQEQQRWQQQLALQQAEAASRAASAGSGGSSGLTNSQLIGLWGDGKISDDYAYNALGIPAAAVSTATAAAMTTPTATVTNSNGRGWVSVSGLGRITASELSNGLSSGSIKARQNNDGSITYVYTG